MELLLPGLGLIYTESYLEAGLEWGGMLLGLAIMAASGQDVGAIAAE